MLRTLRSEEQTVNRRQTFAALLAVLVLSIVFVRVGSVIALDPPHNSYNASSGFSLTCSSCHYDVTTSATPAWLTAPTTTTTLIDNLCLSCHSAGKISDTNYSDISTHASLNTSTKYGNWYLECRTCHNPHFQQQITNFPSDPSVNIMTGTVASLATAPGATMSSLTVSGIMLEAGALVDLMLVPDVRASMRMYRILSNTDTTIWVYGALNPNYTGPGRTFGIRYGRLIKDSFTTPNSGTRQVKFFAHSGPNSFATAASGTATGVCQVCHTQTSSFRNDGTLEGPGHPAFQAGKDCSICHGHLSGFKPACGECHGHPPTVSSLGGPNGLANNDGGTGSSSPGAHGRHAVSSGYACETCHSGGMPASVVYDKLIQIGFSLGSGSYDAGTYDGRVTLANGYTYTSGNAGTAITRNGTMTCNAVYCHSDGTSLATGSAPSGVSPNWAAGSTTCSSCHGFPPSYASGSPKQNSHGSHNYSCENCHYATTTNGSMVANPTNHANAVYDLMPGPGRSFTYSFAPPSGTCSTVSCHSNTGTRWGTSACLDCHSVPQGSRAAISPQFDGNSHHVQGVAVSGSHCYQCHWEASSDGSINTLYHGGASSPGSPIDLVIYQAGSRPTAYTLGTTVSRYTASTSRTQIANVTPHCLGCHSDQNNAAKPFGDGKTPKQYAWDGTSVAARYSQAGTTTWGKYVSTPNAAPKNLTKAYSAHGNLVNNQRGWSLVTGVDGTITNTGGNANVQCFDCHNSHGSGAAGITTRYTSSTTNGGILKDTAAGRGGYAMTYRPLSGGTASERNLRSAGASLCLDCHLTPSAGTTPWGYLSTFGATTAVIGYWDSPYLAPGSAGAQLRYPYKNVNHNAGGHFSASSPLSITPMGTINGLCTACHDPHGVSPTLGTNQQYAVPMLRGTWVTSPYKEDVSPANNAAGTIRTGGVQYHIDQNTFGSSVSNATVTGIVETEAQFAGLCLGCHPKSSLTTVATPSSPNAWKSKDRIHESVKGWKTSSMTVRHKYVCSKCHSPHNGSVLPRLMVTNCLDGQHKGRTGFSVGVTSGSGYGVNVGDTTECYGLSTSLGACGSTGSFGGSGSGRIPGNWSGDGMGSNFISCHEGQTGNGVDQSWNVKTPWAVYPPISLTAGPSAGSFTAAGSNVQATITWSTNIPSSSRVDYGLTVAYGSVVTNSSQVLDHATTLQNLTNHSTYHYSMTSSASDGQQLASGDNVFYVSAPPSVPVPIATASSILCAATCTQTVQWNASTDPDGGPVQYHLQASTDYWFNTVNYDSGWISGTSAAASGLTTNAYYYWRVQARDGNHTAAQDPASAWSPISFFYLYDDRPYIYDNSITAGGFTAIGSDVMATVTWQTDKLSTSLVDYGTSTNVYTQTSGTVSTLVTLHSVLLHAVTNHTTNHYRARSAGGALNLESLSVDHAFLINVPPSVPTLIAAPNAQCSDTCPVTLQWNASTDPDGGAIQYDVQVSSHPSFSVIAYDSGWVSGTGATTSALPTSTVYYWRARSRDAVYTSAVSAWSPSGTFAMENVPLLVSGPSATSFTATTGTNGTTVVTWTTDIPSSSNVDYGLTTAYGSLASGTTGSTGHSVTVTGLTNHSQYHYRVRSTGSFSNEMVSGDYTFSLSVPPTVPTLVHEPSSTCSGSCGVTLQWNASTDPDGGPVQYNIQASTSPAFSSVYASSGWISGTSWLVTLPTNTFWYWRVQARDANHTTVQDPASAWSATDSFMMTTGAAPTQPVLASPANGPLLGSSCDSVYGVVFAWTANALAQFDVQVSTSSGFGIVNYESGWVSGSSWGVTVSVPAYSSVTYYWRVKARDPVSLSESSWSGIWSFSLNDTGPCIKDSCPFIFAWNGIGYEYNTDFQGPVIGLPPTTPAARSVGLFQPSSVVLKGLIPANGVYRLKLRETLKEITYLDEVKLLVIDHPEGYELVDSTAENTYSYGYVNPERVYTIRNPRLPVSAFATNGDDILSSVSVADNLYAPLDYEALEYITLDFGAIADPANAKLVIDGWTYYNESLRIVSPVQPYVEVLDATGSWVKVVSFGEPAGDLKRMVVPLGNVFQNADQRIRLHLGKKSGGRWRLDRVMLDESAPVGIQVREAAVTSASLYHAGRVPFTSTSMTSRIFAEDGSLPDQTSAYGYGSFTRYGDVQPLLTARDDMFVIMRHGDGVDLEFSEVAQQPPGGMVRDYILRADLYYKSFRVENTVEPLPFHGMTIYPPSVDGESYPSDQAHDQYRETYNTRTYTP